MPLGTFLKSEAYWEIYWKPNAKLCKTYCEIAKKYYHAISQNLLPNLTILNFFLQFCKISDLAKTVYVKIIVPLSHLWSEWKFTAMDWQWEQERSFYFYPLAWSLQCLQIGTEHSLYFVYIHLYRRSCMENCSWFLMTSTRVANFKNVCNEKVLSRRRIF